MVIKDGTTYYFKIGNEPKLEKFTVGYKIDWAEENSVPYIALYQLRTNWLGQETTKRTYSYFKLVDIEAVVRC